MSRHIKTTSQCSSYNLLSESNCFLIITKQATSPPEVKLPRLISTSATRQNVPSHTLETTGPFSAPLQVSKLVVHFVCTVNIQEITSVFDTNWKWYMDMESVMSVKLTFDNWCQLNLKKKFNVFFVLFYEQLCRHNLQFILMISFPLWDLKLCPDIIPYSNFNQVLLCRAH